MAQAAAKATTRAHRLGFQSLVCVVVVDPDCMSHGQNESADLEQEIRHMAPKISRVNSGRNGRNRNQACKDMRQRARRLVPGRRFHRTLLRGNLFFNFTSYLLCSEIDNELRNPH